MSIAVSVTTNPVRTAVAVPNPPGVGATPLSFTIGTITKTSAKGGAAPSERSAIHRVAPTAS